MTAATPGLVWTRESRQGHSSRPRLDRETIVRATIDLLDRDGLDSLSMRKLGTVLDAGATTLYWHVTNKEELLDIAFDAVLGELAPPDPFAEWRILVTSAMRDVRAMIYRHPWFAALYATRPSIGPNALRYTAAFNDLLIDVGFAGPALDGATHLIFDYVIGATGMQVTWRHWLASPPGDVDATRKYVQEAVRPYPNSAQHIRDYLSQTDPDAMRERQFEFAVSAILDGLQARLANANPERTSPS